MAEGKRKVATAGSCDCPFHEAMRKRNGQSLKLRQSTRTIVRLARERQEYLG